MRFGTQFIKTQRLWDKQMVKQTTLIVLTALLLSSCLLFTANYRKCVFSCEKIRHDCSQTHIRGDKGKTPADCVKEQQQCENEC